MVNLAKLKSDVLLLMSLEANHLDDVDLLCSSHVLLLMFLQPMIHMNHPAMELTSLLQAYGAMLGGLLINFYSG